MCVCVSACACARACEREQCVGYVQARVYNVWVSACIHVYFTRKAISECVCVRARARARVCLNMFVHGCT